MQANGGNKAVAVGRKSSLDSFDKDAILRCIDKMILERIYVTLKKLKIRLFLNHELAVKRTTLWRTVKELGFKYKRGDSGRRFLKERLDMMYARCKHFFSILTEKKHYYKVNKDMFYLTGVIFKCFDLSVIISIS